MNKSKDNNYLPQFFLLQNVRIIIDPNDASVLVGYENILFYKKNIIPIILL
jgi:hypothetical protein